MTITILAYVAGLAGLFCVYVFGFCFLGPWLKAQDKQRKV